jgi:hypothetical protein
MLLLRRLIDLAIMQLYHGKSKTGNVDGPICDLYENGEQAGIARHFFWASRQE